MQTDKSNEAMMLCSRRLSWILMSLFTYLFMDKHSFDIKKMLSGWEKEAVNVSCEYSWTLQFLSSVIIWISNNNLVSVHVIPLLSSQEFVASELRKPLFTHFLAAPYSSCCLQQTYTNNHFSTLFSPLSREMRYSLILSLLKI